MDAARRQPPPGVRDLRQHAPRAAAGTHQRYELLITGAQSLFAVSLLLNLSLTFRGALGLLSLFAVQFFVSILFGQHVNRVTIVVLSILYGLLAVAQFARHFRRATRLAKDGTVTSFAELPDEPRPEPRGPSGR